MADAARDAAERTYVDFVPPHSLVEEPVKATILVHLSAEFKREQIRLVLFSQGMLRITGERPLEGNQWSRFHLMLPIPEGCNVDGIRAKFEDGDLHITMPMLSPAGEPKAPDTKTGDDASQDQKAAGQEEEDTRKRPDQNEEHTSETDGGRGEPVAAPTTRPACGELRDWRKVVWTLLLAVVLALLVGAALYAKYRLMDPSTEPAPADDGIIGLSDYR